MEINDPTIPDIRKAASYPSSLQRAALQRAIHTLEQEARDHYSAGDAAGEKAARVRRAYPSLERLHLRTREAEHRHAAELQRAADELSNQFPEEGPE